MLSHFSFVRLCATLWIVEAPLSDSQARILEWIAMPSSRGSSQPEYGARVSNTAPALAGRFFTTSAI